MSKILDAIKEVITSEKDFNLKLPNIRHSSYFDFIMGYEELCDDLERIIIHLIEDVEYTGDITIKDINNFITLYNKCYVSAHIDGSASYSNDLYREEDSKIGLTSRPIIKGSKFFSNEIYLEEDSGLSLTLSAFSLVLKGDLIFPENNK